MITLNLAEHPDFNTCWDENLRGSAKNNKKKKISKNNDEKNSSNTDKNGLKQYGNDVMLSDGTVSSVVTSPTTEILSSNILDRPLSTSTSIPVPVPVPITSPHPKGQKDEIDDSSAYSSSNSSSLSAQPSIDAVITVSPRRGVYVAILICCNLHLSDFI